MAVTTDPVVMSNGVAPHLRPAKVKSSHAAASKSSSLDIIDIRRAAVETNLKEEIISLFHPKEGPRQLPTLLLYNERGLQLFEEITYLEEYYLTNDEIQVLRTSSAQIAKEVPDGCMLIELGSGNLRKVNLLLQAIEDVGKSIDYYALDLSRTELERTLAQLPPYKHVRAHGLLGTYDDGREWLKQPSILSRQKCILTLGSSIGNFPRDEASGFLKSFSDVLSLADRMIVGLDACNDPAKVYHAYNDQEGITHQFVLNGLRHANEILGEEVFRLEDWKVIGEYVYDHQGGRHQAFYSPIRDTVVMGELVKAHERVEVEQSLKYSQAETTRLWNQAGMSEIGKWMLGNEYGLHMLAKSNMPYSLLPSVYARSPVPSLDDWDGLWAAWDAVTTKMLPHEELLDKPIKLRNACIFYLGHIPTFLDIQLTKTTKQRPTDPAMYYQIFERGIDPDVDNPELCHAHSEIPDEWPLVDEILDYQERVRERLKSLYNKGLDAIPRTVGRAIWVGFEHEIMHLETLLYMMLQSDKTLPPPSSEQPNFQKLAEKARSARVPNQWFNIPAQDVAIGLEDPEDGIDPETHFGWDNEKPVRQVKVHPFQAQARPITNEEYAQYMNDQHISKLPASWAELEPSGQTNGHSNGNANGLHTNGYGNGYGNGHTNGHANGHTNGYTNGYTNGHTNNGHTNGHSNGYCNGHVNGFSKIPESFFEGKAVRTFYGLVPLKYALDWPIFASYDELAGCASWMGGRIPTVEEARSIYSYVHVQKKLQAEKKLGKTVPAVNGHLSNNGVQETPPSRSTASTDGSPLNQEELFVDLDGANVGLHQWHPVAVTGQGGQLAGQAEMGGVWEWTSSPLTKYEGFEPMSLYPAYTADFFDGKHNIVLGGSWATHPRIAGRKSFVNWYQRNYPYAWCGARLVRDSN